MKCSSSLTLLACGVALGSCAPSLDAPPAPDLQQVLQAYDSPTAVVGSEIMAAVADEIEQVASEVTGSEIFAEIMELIVRVNAELAAATEPNGNLTVDGVTFPRPNTVIQIAFICPGWDERQCGPGYDAEPDLANGTLDLTMTSTRGEVDRVVWGEAEDCLYLVCGDGESFQASYDGGVAIDLGEPVTPDEDVTELLVTFVLNGTVGFDGSDFAIDQSFRAMLADTNALEILVQLGDRTFTYFFGERSQGIRDATGTFGCSLEERRCFNESGTTLFSW